MQKVRLDLARVRELYQGDGMSLAEVARELGCAIGTLKREMRDGGIPIRGKGEKSPRGRRKMSLQRYIELDADRLRAWRDAGWSTAEMSRELGVSAETVRRRMKEAGIERLPPKARMEHNGFWKGGLIVDRSGYILQKAPDHPQATRNGYVRQHRLVMEGKLGRLLEVDEVVDHVNGDTSDNRPENLRVFSTNAEHLRVTLTGSRNLPAVERERLRLQAVRRAEQRVAAILEASGTGAGW